MASAKVPVKFTGVAALVMLTIGITAVLARFAVVVAVLFTAYKIFELFAPATPPVAEEQGKVVMSSPLYLEPECPLRSGTLTIAFPLT